MTTSSLQLNNDGAAANNTTLRANGDGTFSICSGNSSSPTELIRFSANGQIEDSSGVVLNKNKNAIINGDFNVWQRGTSFAAITDGAYSADRWKYNVVGAAVHTVSRSTDVPTVAEAGRLFNYSFLVDCTTVDAAIAAGDFLTIDHRVEGYNWLPLAQRAITLSFWVKGTKTGIHCVSLTNSGSNRSYVAEYTINTTATWELKTISITASPSAGTWDYTTGIGIRISWALSAGSTWQTTAGAWNTGDFRATSSQVNATDSTSNDFRLCGVQLEVGSVATDIEQMTFQEELSLCQRYYEKTFMYATAPAQASGTFQGALSAVTNATGTITGTCNWRYAVSKRSAATITTYNPSQANANWRNAADSSDETVSVANTGDSGAAVNTSTATGTNINYIHAQAVAEL